MNYTYDSGQIAMYKNRKHPRPGRSYDRPNDLNGQVGGRAESKEYGHQQYGGDVGHAGNLNHTVANYPYHRYHNESYRNDLHVQLSPQGNTRSTNSANVMGRQQTM